MVGQPEVIRVRRALVGGQLPDCPSTAHNSPTGPRLASQNQLMDRVGFLRFTFFVGNTSKVYLEEISLASDIGRHYYVFFMWRMGVQRRASGCCDSMAHAGHVSPSFRHNGDGFEPKLTRRH